MDILQQKLIGWIQWYQENIGQGLPTVCRFEPSCSQYTLEAIEEWGSAMGLALGLFRIIRCQPLFRGGFDPVPKRSSKARGKSKADDTYLESIRY